MAESAAELTQIEPPQLYAVPEIPLVEAVSEMIEDRLVRQRAAKFIANCVIAKEVECPATENLKVQPIESLHDAIQKATEGDPVARRMVETNVRTDVIERTIKAGHVLKVDLHVDEAGEILQHGQNIESVQANSLRYVSNSWQMRERTEAEATNAFRIAQLRRQGKLKDYSFVVFSRAADNMTSQKMTDVGFFTDTMSCAIQVTTEKNDHLTTETAFVAGVKKPGEERHDAQTLVAVADRLGKNLRSKTAAQIIDYPFLVHNSLLPNGAINLVELWDENNSTFFGEERPVEDYLEYLNKCQEREEMFQPKVDSIVQELINEAPTIENPLDAVKRLHKLSGKHMIEQATFDHSINPQVFGPVAAQHIEQARILFEQGDYTKGVDHITVAKANDRSNSCPSGLNSSTDPQNTNDEKANDNGDCEYVSKECPICHEKNVKTKVKKISETKTIISGSCGCAIIK